MNPLSRPFVVSNRRWYEKIFSSFVLRFILYFCCILVLFVLLFFVYLKYAYKNTLTVFLSEKLPKNSVLNAILPGETISSLTFEDLGGGNYLLKFRGKFVSLEEDKGNNRIVYLIVDSYLKERVEVKYSLDYSRTYWSKTVFDSQPSRFSGAKHFPDPTNNYPECYVVGSGYTYLAKGDSVEFYILINEEVKKMIISERRGLRDKLKEIPIYFLFVDTT